MQSVCEMHECCVETRGPPLLSFCGSCPPWVLFAFVCFICFETGSLVGLRFSALGRLADQQAQGIIQSHPPGLGLECAAHPAFLWVLGIKLETPCLCKKHFTK